MTPPFEFEGKEYLSAKDAAKRFGYTSDYVGQLARAEKVSSRLVGHTRFVDLESITKYSDHHKNGNLDKSPAETLDIHAKDTETSREPARLEKVRILKKERLLPSPYTAIATNESVGKATTFLVAVLVVFGTFLFVQSGHALSTSALLERGVVAVGERTIAVANGVRKEFTDLGYGITQFVFDVRSDGIAVVFKESGDVLSLYTSIALKGSTNTPGTLGASTLAYVASSQQFGIGTFLVEIVDGMRAVLSRFLVSVGIDTESDTNLTTATQNRVGLAVIPSSGDKMSDTETVKNVKQSFSDEVRVYPDEDGLSGLIEPIFRESRGLSYLYVIVPVEEEKR